MNLWSLFLVIQSIGFTSILAQGGDRSTPCSTPERRQGACVNIRRCVPLIRVLQAAARQPEAAVYLRNSVCGYEGSDPKVCCALVATPTTSKPAPITKGLLTKENGCGFSNATHPKVVGGTPAELNSWPWLAVLGYRRGDGTYRWLCGGTLVSDRHIVTAAHCVFGRDDLEMVRLGELDLASTNDGAHPIDIPIAEKIMHEQYNRKSSTNDIAVLTLRSPVTFSESIKPICLPTPSDVRNDVYVRKFPFVAGWGALRFGGPSATKLQELQIPVVTNEQCKENYASFKAQIIDERVLCAGYANGGKDACQGDSGGPLMLPVINDNRDGYHYYLIGVVSYGFKCAEPGFPGVYTRVSQFLPWIESKLL
ncbi:venom protease-like [Ctenocephalides felis]|uniref:venom protease-like n=1 Tax=Ctenocephalides felis TaxID=7515 RepID=UPI000E6E1B62|nr:venom protease-like [Ctenocephalides felis]